MCAPHRRRAQSSSLSVLLAIRPEKVTICEAAGDDVDAHPAQVIGRVFRGHLSRVPAEAHRPRTR